MSKLDPAVKAARAAARKAETLARRAAAKAKKDREREKHREEQREKQEAAARRHLQREEQKIMDALRDGHALYSRTFPVREPAAPVALIEHQLRVFSRDAMFNLERLKMIQRRDLMPRWDALVLGPKADA